MFPLQAAESSPVPTVPRHSAVSLRGRCLRPTQTQRSRFFVLAACGH